MEQVIKREAIILAGGLGTRLRSALPDIPKCMAPIQGTPFLAFVIEWLLDQGVDHFIFSLGYKHEMISAWLEAQYPALNISVVLEEEPLGTGGGIKLACSKTSTGTVVVVNGDTLFKVNVNKLMAFHDMCGAHCTLALKPMHNFDRYGMVVVEKDYSVKEFREKQFCAEGLINGGVYTLNVKKFLAESLPEKFSFEKDYLEKFVGQRRFYGYVQDEYFIDIGIPEDYLRAQEELS